MALNKKIINFETKALFQSANGINKTTILLSLSDCINVANVGKCIGNIPWRSIVTIQDTNEIWTHGVYIGGYINNNTIYLGGKSLNLLTFGNSNYVTLNTVQTITANKTFTGSVEFKGSTTASAIVTDNNSNIVFDTLNNIVYAGDKSLLIATLKNGGNIYGTLTAIPNNGLYYNNNKLLTSNEAFSDLSSNKEYLISITIGDVTKRLSSSIIKTNLGLGLLAFVNSLTYADVGASPNNHTHAITINGISKSLTTSGTIDLGSYLPLSGGTMAGSLKWANSTALPELTSPQYFICIDAFEDGGTTKWASKANTLKALTGLTSTAIGDLDEPIYWNGTTFIKANAYPTKSSWNYDDKYLQLSGGTMTGSITFANTSPLLWNSGTYHQRIFITDDSTNDTAVFTFLQSADSGTNWNNLMTIRDNGKVIANTFAGSLSGNADTASKWATARTITLTGSVTGSVSIDGSGDVSLVTTTNHTHSYLPISGGTMSGNIILKGGTSADMTYEGNLHPYIRFDNSDSTQNVSLIFTDYDTYRSPAGIKLIGNQGGEWFEVPNIYATNLYGNGFNKNGSSNSYVLLGGGDHKALSDFSMAHEHPYLQLTGGTLTGPIEINSTASGNYNEGLRITRAANNWAGITFGSTGLSGAPTNGWFVATNPDKLFIISPDSSSNATGLTLNKDGDILWRNNKLLHSGNVTISNYVTLNTTLTITGLKIFTGGVQFKGSNEAHAIVTDNDANLVFDTINNLVYTGDTSLLLASFRNGGNIYGLLTAIPNEVTGLYYNSYRLLTNLDFTDVFSTTEYPVNVTIGNITRKISGSVLKTSLGLGSLAFRNNLLQSDIPLLDASIIVSGEFPNSRILNPQITIAGKVVTLGSEITANELLTLLNLTSAMHFVGISTTDPKTSGATVSGVSTWKAGDIVLYNTKEYILTSNTNSKDNWTELGDESSYALKNHTHDYLPLTGGTINGNLIVNGNTTFKGSTSYSAIVTDGGSNIVFDTLNNIVYTGDTLLLLASFKNGGTTYGTLTAVPNLPTGLYYNGYKIITTNDFSNLFDDLYSNTEYLINVVIGGVTKRITTSAIKTNLGLGQLAFKNTLSYIDVGAAAQNHTHNYLSLSGGTLTGVLNLLGNQYTDSANTGTLNLSNSDIYGVNSIKFADLCDGPAEGLQWYRDSTHVDTIWVKNGVIYFTPNREWSTSGTSYTVYHSGNLSVSNLVTINTTQTITGSKLFTGGVEFRGSNAAAAIVTDNDANLVFDTLNNQVYAGNTSLLLATFKNGGNIYGTLTAIPNEEQGLYYNNHRLLTADNAFVDLYSNSEYLVVVSIGNVIKKLSTSSIKSNLGLGLLAYKNSLTYTDVNAAASNHTHAYLPLSGGTVTGQLYLTGLDEGSSDVTDNTEILTSYASNNGFADSNAVGKVYRRDAICIYNYIKNKLSGVYAPASHTHSYLPLSGGTMTGLIIGNNKGGYWIAGRTNATIYLSRNTSDDWHPVIGFKTKTGSWEFGNDGSSDSAVFSWGSDSNYSSGTNTTTIVNLRAINGTIALTSEIPTKASWNYDDVYSKLRHTHDDRYYTETEINAKLGTYLPLTGGIMTGNITYTDCGTSYIGKGENDGASGVGGALDNLVISSWYGVSFTTSCGNLTYTNKNAVSINCRNGYVYANTFVGTFSGNASSATNTDKLDNYHETAFFRHRGSYGKSYTDASTEYVLNPGTYTTSENGFSGTLVAFNSSNSTSALQFWTHYLQGNLYYRTSVDSNHWGKTNGAWTKILDSDNYITYTVKKDGTGASGTWDININGSAKSLSYTGLGTSVFTVAQTNEDFCGRSGWATYLIGNHGNGSTYYRQVIAMRFSGMPQYQRLENGTQGAWYTFAMMGYGNSGNLYADHFYENSDIRYKHNIKDRIIEITDLASLPIFDYTWKDSIEINTGTSAQAVLKILPTLVTEKEHLTLNYSVLGTIAGITACKELVTLKSEIELLKDRVKLLEQKLKMYNVND